MDSSTKAKLESLAEYTKGEWMRLNYDRKGKISLEDLEEMFKRIKSCTEPRENAMKMMESIDADGSNDIDVGEFVRTMYADLAADEGLEVRQDYIDYVIKRCNEMIPADQR